MKMLALILSLFLVSPSFAALDFNGTSDKIAASTAVLTAAPLTMCAWVNKDNATADGTIIHITDTGSTSRHFLIHFKATGDEAEYWANEAANVGTSDGSVSYTATTWHHMCGVEVSSTSRFGYLNGATAGENTTSVVPGSIDSTRIGVRSHTSDAAFFGGLIAEVAIWNRALSVAEIASLAAGYSPNCFRTGLVNYTNLIRTVQDEARAIAWSTTGTTVADHPRIIYCH